VLGINTLLFNRHLFRERLPNEPIVRDRVVEVLIGSDGSAKEVKVDGVIDKMKDDNDSGKDGKRIQAVKSYIQLIIQNQSTMGLNQRLSLVKRIALRQAWSRMNQLLGISQDVDLERSNT